MDIPPLPTPFPLPPLDPGSGLDTSPLWDPENIGRLLSAFQTVFLLAKENYIITAFIVLAIVAGCIVLVARTVGMGGNAFERQAGIVHNQRQARQRRGDI